MQTNIQAIDAFTESLATSLRPTTFREVLGWGSWLWLACPPYRQAIMRGTSYFMTEIDVESRDESSGQEEELKQARKHLNKHFSSTDELLIAMQEAFGFGGCCLYLHFPLNKLLVCTCGATMLLENGMRNHSVDFDVEKQEYSGVCPECKKQTVYQMNQMRDVEEARNAKIIRIPLSVCRPVYNPLTKDRRLYVDVRGWESASRGIIDKDPMVHATTHSIFIEAACKNSELLLKDKFFHYIGFNDASMIEMTLDGWNLPPFFYAFSDVVAIILLQKYNQTILKDYVLPLRYVAPPPTVGGSRVSSGETAHFDPTRTTSGSSVQFRDAITSFITALRANPDRIGVAPFPIQFGYLGLEGKQMLTVDVMQYYVDQLMQDMGIPPELYRGGIQSQVATPTHYGFALFERTWRGLTAGTVGAYQWVANRVAEAQRWPSIDVSMIPPTQFADPALLPILQYRNDQGKLSDGTFNRVIGVKTDYERKATAFERKQAAEDFNSEEAKAMRKQVVDSMMMEAGPNMQAYQQVQMASQEQQMQAAGGTGVPPAAPGMMPPMGPPASPDAAAAAPQGMPGSAINPAEQQVMDRVYAQAQQMAEQLFMRPIPERSQTLRDMEAQDPQLSALVKEALDEKDKQAARMGVEGARSGQLPLPPAQ